MEIWSRISEYSLDTWCDHAISYRGSDCIYNRHSCKLHREKIIEEAYDPRYGARPIKRYITKNIENLIAHKLIDENMKVGTTLIVDIKDNEFIVSTK